MSRTVVLFGTESGNAEMVAEDLELEIEGETAVEDMTDFDLDDLTPDDFYIIVCSTHGDGELPTGARPFAASLAERRPDLTGYVYAVFGLGDSSYETYSHGSELIDEQLTALGAQRVGVYGRHDASDGSLPNDAAIEWVKALLASRVPA